ncbi:MAG: carbon-nitrogen family hydrolase [Thermodesulfobacteriota bacterium]|nr:carbon-nitrogen family hydrolase [Thermodesulfobacteriota bacterium]
MNVVALQLDVVWENPKENYRRVLRYAREAADAGADVFVLPEMFATGFSMNLQVTTEKYCGETTGFLRSIAREFDMNVIGGLVLEGKEKRGRNTALAVGRDGNAIAIYTKSHLIGMLKEDIYHEPGDGPQIFTLDDMDCACFICYDLRFPELFRLVADNCSLVFVIASWPSVRHYHWDMLLKARAIENQNYVVGVNRIGEGGGITFAGGTMICSPLGDVIAHGGDKEGLILGDVNQRTVKEIRCQMPFLNDRRF